MSEIDLIKKFATWVLEMAKYIYEITNEMWAVVGKFRSTLSTFM